ncbi:hypothetical protein Acr_24g0016660 [Actinidia rufa]|uniref:Uncharacterized protein n=1 Tax=Actinidia rufa TaxID=165716 RepID=A0A7J0GXG2_9ERIC|nr:hypothetical protein Acr_24g0016660 [Actinidia rufa]
MFDGSPTGWWLNKEVRSLDEDNWMFDGPWSHIHLLSRSGQFFNQLCLVLSTVEAPVAAYSSSSNSWQVEGRGLLAFLLESSSASQLQQQGQNPLPRYRVGVA